MDDDLSRLEDWATPLLAKLEAGERKTLARTIAQDLRRSQRERIKQQQNPDGSAFIARKFRGKGGRIKRKAMFMKLRQNKHLKARYNADSISVGFFGRVAHTARVHQEGLYDKTRRGGPDVRYEQRELLGFSAEDISRIEDSFLRWLGN